MKAVDLWKEQPVLQTRPPFKARGINGKTCQTTKTKSREARQNANIRQSGDTFLSATARGAQAAMCLVRFKKKTKTEGI